PRGVVVPDEDAEWSQRESFVGEGEARFSPDGRLFVVLVRDQFHVFDATTARELRAFPTGARRVLHLTVSPDGKFLLGSSWGDPVQTKLPDGRVQSSPSPDHPLLLWDLSAGKLVRKVMLPGSEVGPAAFSPDGRLFAAGVGQPPGQIRLWEVAS